MLWQNYKTIIPAGKLTINEALQVYKDGYFARLTEALGQTFEATWRVMGDEDFFQACKKYIQRNPSKFYDLSDYGANLPKFLSKKSKLLGDLAQFEWIFKNIFHKNPPKLKNNKPVNLFASLKRAPDIKLTFIDACEIFESKFRVYDLWKLRDQEEADVDWQKIKTPQWLIVYKRETQIYILEISKKTHQILTYLKANKSLTQSVTKSNATTEEVIALFKQLSETQIISKVKVTA